MSDLFNEMLETVQRLVNHAGGAVSFVESPDPCVRLSHPAGRVHEATIIQKYHPWSVATP